MLRSIYPRPQRSTHFSFDDFHPRFSSPFHSPPQPQQVLQFSRTSITMLENTVPSTSSAPTVPSSGSAVSGTSVLIHGKSPQATRIIHPRCYLQVQKYTTHHFHHSPVSPQGYASQHCPAPPRIRTTRPTATLPFHTLLPLRSPHSPAPLKPPIPSVHPLTSQCPPASASMYIAGNRK